MRPARLDVAGHPAVAGRFVWSDRQADWCSSRQEAGCAVRRTCGRSAAPPRSATRVRRRGGRTAGAGRVAGGARGAARPPARRARRCRCRCGHARWTRCGRARSRHGGRACRHRLPTAGSRSQCAPELRPADVFQTREGPNPHQSAMPARSRDGDGCDGRSREQASHSGARPYAACGGHKLLSRQNGGFHSAAVLLRGLWVSSPPVPRTYDCTRWFHPQVRQTSTT